MVFKITKQISSENISRTSYISKIRHLAAILNAHYIEKIIR